MNETFKEFIQTILLGLILAMVVKFFVADIVHVRGESMEPTIQNKDILVMEKVSYYFKEPKVGDVVIVTFDNYEERLIKRVVGVPGDEIEIKDGFLYRNGKKVEEPYIKEKMEGDEELVEIPKGYVFVLGDNRNNSLDSRYFGAAKFSEIDGKVLFEVKNDLFKTY